MGRACSKDKSQALSSHKSTVIKLFSKSHTKRKKYKPYRIPFGQASELFPTTTSSYEDIHNIYIFEEEIIGILTYKCSLITICRSWSFWQC